MSEIKTLVILLSVLCFFAMKRLEKSVGKYLRSNKLPLQLFNMPVRVIDLVKVNTK